MRRLVTFLTVLYFSAALILAEDEDYYDVLGLPEKDEATERDIKKQFRVLSKQFHPDLNPTDEAREKYKLVQRAYEVLSDRRKRKIYDMKGEEGLKQLEKSNANPHAHHDPFAAFFGGGGQQGNPNKGQNAQLSMQVPLRDIYNGAHHRITLSKQKLCKKCRGTGAHSKADFKKCTKCGGSGHVKQRIQLMPGFVQEVQNQCPACGGKGQMIKKKCSACKGKKVVRGDHMLEVEIEQGVPDGHQIVYEMEADQSPDVIPGDVIFVVNTKQDDVFTRKGDDLEAKMTISLKEALLGFRRELTHMDDRKVPIVRKGVTQYGFVLKVPGEGMPKHNVPSEKGDLFVTFTVNFPRTLTEPQKEKLSKVLGMEMPTAEQAMTLEEQEAAEEAEEHDEE